MIFVTAPDGEVTYVSLNWCSFTGRDAASTTRHGWLDAVHPDDREIAVNFLRNARDRQCKYSFRHRLRRADGIYAWVAGGAVPSFGPPDHTFLGYLSSLTEIAVSGSEPLAAYGTLARYVPPPAHPATTSNSALELVANHLLMAHSLIEEDVPKEMLPVLRQALLMAGTLLARSMTSPDADDRFH
ncbi:PAS domain-containing protein [Methylobacterium sp. A49B]